MHLALFPRRGASNPPQAARVNARTGAAPVTIALSVDAGRPQSTLGPDAQNRLHATATALYTLCGELDLPATWGVSDIVTSPLVDRLRSTPRANPPHEIAVRLDPRWTSPHSRRMLLADALQRQTRQAELAGLQIKTVFADEPLLSGHYDLLVKRGITGVRSISPPGRRQTGTPAPRPLRYGLWRYDLSHNLPDERASIARRITGRSTAVQWPGSGAATRAFHLSIDLARLTAGNRVAWRSVERNLRLLVRLRENAGLRIAPLRAATARLAAVPAAAPQTSILRRAA